MALSRRDFVKLCSGTVAGFGVSQMFHPAIHEAFAQTLTGERPPVFWVQAESIHFRSWQNLRPRRSRCKAL